MKIYNKSAFMLGVSCAGALLFFALGVIAVEWWQWAITIAISGKYLYIGLSKTSSENANAIHQHYHTTAVKLYGKYALIKTNLPIVFLAGFFGVALFIRFVFDVITPVSIAALFCILLTISVIYSIGLERNIKNTIIDEKESAQEKQ